MGLMSDHYEATIGACRIEVEATTNMIAYNYHLIINDQKVDTAAATVVGVAYLRGLLKTKSEEYGIKVVVNQKFFGTYYQLFVNGVEHELKKNY